jgi:hypothetical protein
VDSRPSTRLTRSEGRKFGLVLGGALIAVGGILVSRDRRTAGATVLVIGGILTAAALIIPTRLGPVQTIWMGLGRALSKITTPISMSIVFFLVLTPIGLLARAFGHRPLTSRRGRASSWVDRPEGRRRSDLERQF